MKLLWDHLEEHRIGGDRGQRYGSFALKLNHPDGNVNREWYAQIIAAADFPETAGWQHVSVCMRGKRKEDYRLPTWHELRQVKDLFWNEDETVVSFFPKKSEYINVHEWVLHLWSRADREIELPPSILIGPKQ